MRENKIEKELVDEVKRLDGLCIKFISPSFNGVPDRIVLMHDGKLAFVEVKAPGKKPRPIQLKRIRQLKRLGFKCYVLDEPLDIKEIINEIQAT